MASGKPQTPSYFTTLTIQSAALVDIPLDAALQVLFGSLSEAVGSFHMAPPQPAVLCGRPAIVYSLSFKMLDADRLRLGALVDAHGGQVDLALAGVSSHVPKSVDVLHTALAELDCFGPVAERAGPSPAAAAR